MKQLASRVNLVPVITKGDTLTNKELEEAKEVIKRAIKENDIPVYDYEVYLHGTSRLPFCVTTAPGLQNEEGKVVALRRYPWGNFNSMYFLISLTHLSSMNNAICDYFIFSRRSND